jgi:hypothetical protein
MREANWPPANGIAGSSGCVMTWNQPSARAPVLRNFCDMKFPVTLAGDGEFLLIDSSLDPNWG